MLNRIRLFFAEYPALRFLLLFIFSYLCIYYLFLGYVALEDGRGIYSSEWIRQHSLIQGLTNLLKFQVGFIMNLLGHTNYYSLNGIHLESGHIIFIEFSCLGIQVMIAFTALMLAYPGRRRVLFWAAGIAMVQLLNICRMLAIFFFWLNGSRSSAFLIHDWFNYFAYACVLILFFVYTRQAKKTRQDNAA